MSKKPEAIKFPTTPTPAVELLQDQLQGALQIIAALVLTPEEGESFCSADNAQRLPTPQWIESMRAELLSEAWRPTLITALRRQDWLTNTHPGFCLNGLVDPPPNTRLLAGAYQELERLLREYAEGKGDTVPEDYKAHWVARLVTAGFPDEVAQWVMRTEGAVLACEASMARHMFKKPYKHTSEGN